jgi:hypothetical protein
MQHRPDGSLAETTEEQDLAQLQQRIADLEKRVAERHSSARSPEK